MNDITVQGFDEFSTVYSNDFRLYLLENELRLTKKYLRDIISYSNQLIDYETKMHHNQKLLEWGFIRHEERLAAVEEAQQRLEEEAK
jgi:hypothetical protein